MKLNRTCGKLNAASSPGSGSVWEELAVDAAELWCFFNWDDRRGRFFSRCFGGDGLMGVGGMKLRFIFQKKKKKECSCAAAVDSNFDIQSSAGCCRYRIDFCGLAEP